MHMDRNMDSTDTEEKMVSKSKKSRERAPHTKPPFTYAEIKKAVPAHCFERSIVRSFSYLAFDLIFGYLFYIMATTYMITKPQSFASGLMYVINWTIYALLQGSAFAGLFFLGHECGHHAFTDYEWLDDTVGFIIHTFILWPYFSFKYSHRRHHANTGHVTQEEVETPMVKSQVPYAFRFVKYTAGRFVAMIFLLFSGVPLYLYVNFRGRTYERFASHLDPTSPMFSSRQRNHVLLSNVGIFAVIFGLYKLAMIKGFAWVALVYVGPYLVQGAIVTLITTLQHIDRTVPYYDSTEWDWLRGSLASIDRDYGTILNIVFHHGPTAHVAHHLFPSLPHYHGEEATRAFKPILGEYYQYDDTPFYKALWNILNECIYVEEDEGEKSKGVFWYKSISDYLF